jgi:hypothetical protein
MELLSFLHLQLPSFGSQLRPTDRFFFTLAVAFSLNSSKAEHPHSRLTFLSTFSRQGQFWVN